MVPELIACLQNDGAKDYTEELAQEYTCQAIQSIESLTNVSLNIQKSVLELTYQLLNRKN